MSQVICSQLTIVPLLLGGLLLRQHEVVLLLVLLCGELLLLDSLSLSLGLSLCLRLRLRLGLGLCLSLRRLLRLHGRGRLARARGDARRQSETGRARAHVRRQRRGRNWAVDEVRVCESVVGGVSPVGLELEQVLEKGDGVARRLGDNGVQRLLGVFRQRLLELDLGAVHLDLLQRRVGRRADNLHDLDKLVVVVAAAEEGVARDHLGEDAADGPDVNRGRVRARAEEDVRRAVP